ncbi:MAG: glycosyl hydrolase family 39 [Acidobacteriota bacterium]|nr:glycosyl hydrolase family 39 [Acidobacteriota bacterium]
MAVKKWCAGIMMAGAVCIAVAQQGTPEKPVSIKVDWSKTQPLQTTPTLQLVVNPMLRRGSPIHDATFAALKQLGADDVRYAAWHPYPKLAVAELQPPTAEKTSWDFSSIDPILQDFLDATRGHDFIFSLSTNPAWMYKTAKPVTYPEDPDKLTWDYTQGKELRDPTCAELAAYYTRVAEWYTQGGFTDELGKRHKSGYHYTIPYWEVFNEIDVEHQPTPEQYVQRYDAIVAPLHKMDPAMKFVGLAMAFPERNPGMVEYFLDHSHHQAGIPLDMISYHFYAIPAREQTAADWQYSFFDQADRLITTIRFVELMRKRLSPETKTTLDEVGTILPTDWHPDNPYDPGPPIPAVYWNASGAMFAYIFLEAAKQDIAVVGESQLVGFPSQFPSVTMVDWTTGKPNARFEVLRLLHDATHIGDAMAQTRFLGSDIDVQALDGPAGKRLLLVNKRDRSISVDLPAEFASGELRIVAGGAEPRTSAWRGSTLTLPPFAVTALTATSAPPAAH